MIKKIKSHVSGFLLAMLPFLALTASAGTVYVDCKLPSYAGHDGTSWEKAFETIQEGVDAASTGDTVLVASGDYVKGGKQDAITNGGLSNRVLIAGKAITLKSQAGAAATRIIGARDSDTLNDATYPGLGPNAVRCVCVVASAESEAPVIEGFTIMDGATDSLNSSQTPRTCGGGVIVRRANADYKFHAYVVDCVVTNCIAVAGGGMDGGRYVRCRVEDCDTFSANTPVVAIHAELFNCLIAHNGGRGAGRGMIGYMFDNRGERYMGSVVNCTFVGNAGQVCDYYAGNLYNCILTENGNTTLWTTYTTYSNCLVDVNGGKPNDTCIKPTDNFQLFAPARGDYRLLPTSLAVGAGDVAHLDLIPAAYRDKDISGNPRTTDGTVNIGCAETTAPAPAGGAIVFLPKCVVDGFPGYGAWLHAYADDYPVMFDVKVSSANDIMFLESNAGVASGIRWYPKWDDGRIGMVPPPSSYVWVYCSEAKQTFWVQDGYAGGDSDGSSTRPYATIQDAVKAAGSLNTVIKVRPGTYATGGEFAAGQTNRVVVSDGQNVRIVSTDGPAATTICGANDETGDAYGCGQNSVRCVCTLNVGTAVIQGFTLSGGRSSEYAGGLHAGNTGSSAGSSKAVLTDCIVTNCIAPRAAAAYVGRLDRCWIVDNRFTNGDVSNDIAEQGVYSSCVFSGNHAPDQSFNHPVVGMAGYMVHCSGLGDGTVCITDSNVIQMDCVWDSYLRATMDGGGMSRGSYAINTPVANNGAGHFGLASSPLARTLPYCRPYADSPAVAGGSADHANYFRYATLDYEGWPIRFVDGKPTAGAFQYPLPSAVATSVNATGGISPERADGSVAGEVVTFTATKAGQRPFLGLRVDGELLEGVASYDWTVPEMPCFAPARIEAVYGTNWYVRANGGDDSRYGSSWAEARQTLEGVMTNAISGDVVIAGPGMYDAGSMAQSAGAALRSRVVVPAGVTLRSSEGPEKTFIVGTSASNPVDEYGNGADAMRGVFMMANSRLIGFTVTGGRTNRDLDNETVETDHNRGGGIWSASQNNAFVEDCIISNNVAVRAGGVFQGVYSRCRFLGNRAIIDGSAGRNCSLADCLIDKNVGGDNVLYIYFTMQNCTFGANNRDKDGNVAGIRGYTRSTSEIVNSVILAGPVSVCSYMSNTIYTAAVSFSNMPTPDDSCLLAAADDLEFDAAGRPASGNSVTVDFGNASLRGGICGDRDLTGGQRIYNGNVDAGCGEYDWRPVYARTLGGSKAEVGYASPDVVRQKGNGAVSLSDGCAMEISLANTRRNQARYEITAKVVGTGTLSLLRGGEAFHTFVAQGGSAETVRFSSSEPLESLSFAFSGEGTADLLSCKIVRGTGIFFK